MPTNAKIVTSDPDVRFQLSSLLRAAARGQQVDPAQAREMLTLLAD